MKGKMKQQVVFSFIFFIYELVFGQLQYSIPEELKQGSIVGSITKDLGLNVKELLFRKFQIISHGKQQYLKVNLENGDLLVTDRIDREVLCGIRQDCFLSLEAVIENPLNFYIIKVEIQDINDNAPLFSKNTLEIGMAESALPGIRFALENAHDADLGMNSIQSYMLSANEYFTLEEKITTDGIKYPELVLERLLDREKQSCVEIILIALDGGKPAKTGTAYIQILIYDVNDNFPIFTQDTYNIHLSENAPQGFLVVHLNATDKDEGANAQLTYSFTHILENAREIFQINPITGEIKIVGKLDYEAVENYEMTVEAKDGGGLVTHCRVSIQVIDINDNAPEIIITSLSDTIPEDSAPGTAIALVNVRDLDSGENGEVICEFTEKIPFEMISFPNSYYKVVTSENIDRENNPLYNILIRAVDKGSPQLSSNNIIKLTISDVNDNPPIFERTHYIVYVTENNLPGTAICSVCASDLDLNENGKITYSIINNNTQSIHALSYVSINSLTGVIYAQRSFDYEELRELQLKVMAKDNGSPPLSCNVTVQICIIDKNDNPPKILYPSPDTDETALFEFIPRSSEKGNLVIKVVAVDADSGHNAWLSFQFLEVPDPLFFTIGQHTGEIRIARDLQDTVLSKQKVVVLVKDNGVPSLSATVTINFVVAESFQHVYPEIVKRPREQDMSSNVTFYLVVSITLISFLFIFTVVITVIAKCRKTHTSTAFGSLSRTWYPQLSLTHASQFSDGSLPLPYSYDVCVTLDSKQNEIAFLKPAENVPTDNLIDTADSETGNDSTRNIGPPACLNQVRCLHECGMFVGTLRD